jgi:carboxypeptidase Taq
MSYDLLCDRFRRIAAINEAASMLSWDAAAMMPPGGAAARGDQLAVLAGLAHEKMTAPELAEWFARATATDKWEVANLQLMRRAHLRATALPASLVEAQARANSTCEKVWRTARANADFAAVRPYLAEVVKLVREGAEALAPVLGLSPYDVLMDMYQPGILSADVTPNMRFSCATPCRRLKRDRRSALRRPVRPDPFRPTSRRHCAAGFHRRPA